VLAVFVGISDTQQRADIKRRFARAFGTPANLTAEQMPAVFEWLHENVPAEGEEQ
jgi:hypothetical protein